MSLVKTNGIEIEVEEHGPRNGPAVLLIMGLAAQLTLWPRAFIDGLVDAGYRVITFDNRDVGLSQKFKAKHAPNPAAVMAAVRIFGFTRIAPYKLTDMAADSVGVMDALGVDRAHVVGVSMGGMIGQILAAEHPERVRSFTAIMSSTNNPNLPTANPELLKKVFRARSRPKTREELVDRMVGLWGAIGTKDGGNDPEDFRKRVAAQIDRCNYPAGVRRQTAAVIATGDLRKWSAKISAPTLVIHGSADPLSPFQGGLDIAATIKDAKIEIIDGMGHDLPPKFTPKISELVAGHLRSAEERAASRAA